MSLFALNFIRWTRCLDKCVSFGVQMGIDENKTCDNNNNNKIHTRTSPVKRKIGTKEDREKDFHQNMSFVISFSVHFNPFAWYSFVSFGSFICWHFTRWILLRARTYRQTSSNPKMDFIFLFASNNRMFTIRDRIFSVQFLLEEFQNSTYISTHFMYTMLNFISLFSAQAEEMRFLHARNTKQHENSTNLCSQEYDDKCQKNRWKCKRMI